MLRAGCFRCWSAAPRAVITAMGDERHLIRSGGFEPSRWDAFMPGQDGGGRDLSVGAAVTFVDHLRPDRVIVRWESRRHRKHLKEPAGSTWWAPRARGWWIAV